MDDRTDEATDRVLREKLRTLPAPEGHLDPDPLEAVRRRLRQRRNHRRRTAVLAAAAAVLIAVGIVTVAGGGGNEESIDVVSPSTVEDTNPSPTATTSTTTPGPEPILPVAPDSPPLDLRGDVAMAWTGSEVVVWGGDVEAFNMGVSGSDRSFADGAAFDPATATWRAMSPSPLPATAETPVATMTERGVVVVRGTATAVWDPVSDTWRQLDEAPGPAAPEQGGTAQLSALIPDGDRVISPSANAILDVETGTWSAIPDPPVRLERPAAAWTGDELILIGADLRPSAQVPAVAYDPGQRSWRTLAPAPDGLGAQAPSVAWDGRRAVVVNRDMTAAAYDPVGDRWSPLPAVPAREYEWVPQTLAGGGLTTTLMAQTIAVLDEDDRWEPLPYDTLPVGRTIALDGSTLVATWSTDSEAETNALTVIDPIQLLAEPRRQVGAGSIELEPADDVTNATYDDTDGVDQTIEVTISTRDGGTCSVTSTYLATGPPLDGEQQELPGVQGPITWTHDPDERTWETNATDSDRFRITCDQPVEARRLATTADFIE